jgi:hypothetical protein
MGKFARLLLAAALVSAAGLYCGPAAALAAGNPAFLQLDPGYAELGALVEPVDVSRLEEGALLASGVRPENLPAYEARLGAILGELAGSVGKGSGQAEAVLSFLHKSILRSYSEDATTVDGILDQGLFNCVSSAVLYSIAARSLGIEVSGARTADHAFCVVRVGGRSVDVETTNPYGFDPGGKKEFKDSFGRTTGFAYVAPGGYGDRKPIGAGELVGLILSNRASSLERSGRFAEAVRLGADYAALCPGPDSRSFLVDRINNLVASLASRRDYAGAEAAASAALAALPGEPKLAELAKTASYNRAASLIQAGDWPAAFDAALRAAASYPADQAVASLVANSLAGIAEGYARNGDYSGARRAVADRAQRAGQAAAASAFARIGEIELVSAANSQPFALAAATADRILAAGEVGVSRYAQAIATIYGNEAGRQGSGGDWLGGAALADKGAAKLRAVGAASGAAASGARSFAEDLANLGQSLRHNFAAEAHNRFARAYNSGDYAAAKAAIVAALAALPDDPSLKRDLAAAQSALGERTPVRP